MQAILEVVDKGAAFSRLLGVLDGAGAEHIKELGNAPSALITQLLSISGKRVQA